MHANGETVTLTGWVDEEPDRRPLQTKYTVRVHLLTNGSGATAAVHGRVLATDHRQWPEFSYGDPVHIRGLLERPGAIETFRYDNYLSLSDIYAVMYRASIQRAEGVKSGNALFAILFHTKQQFEAQINRLYPEPHASFMAGILTGSRKGIPDAVLEDFNTTGLTHIIAISGYNITIVVSVVSAALFWVPLRWRLVPSMVAIIAFTLFVGASAAVVRSAIMGILGVCALTLGRQYHVRLAILWAAFGMLCWNLKFLWYDAGFQLSFLAVIGLTELSPLLNRIFARVPAVLGLREGLQMTCAAQVFAVPLIVLLFGRLSLIAPIANVLVAPFIPLAMLFGFLGTIVSTVAFVPGQIIAYLGWGCLEWILQVSQLLARIPFASIHTPIINTWGIVLYYTLLLIGILRANRTQISCDP
jgi:competence protein ComEC